MCQGTRPLDNYECISQKDWEFLWMHFNGPTALGYYEEYEKNGIAVIEASDGSTVEATMRRILSLTQNKELNSEITVSFLIVQILTRLLIDNSSQCLGLGYMPEYIKETISIIENRFCENMSLQKLSEEIGISKYHLEREFKRYIGIPINEYLISTRLNYAKELLHFSDKSIDEISYQCGFGSGSYFISIIKKHEQITPLQYRKEWR